MAEFLRDFELHSEYESYIGDSQVRELPNVSHCEDDDDKHYTPYPVVMATFVVTDDSEMTQVCGFTIEREGQPNETRTTRITNVSYIEIDGIEVSKDDIIANEGKYQLSNGTHIISYKLININNVENYMFSKCASYTTESSNIILKNYLSGAIIPNCVKTIGQYAFSTCYGITSVGRIGDKYSVQIPNSVTSIGNYAFINCINITKLVIPKGIVTIGGQAFRNCTKMGNFYIPKNVTTIGSGAFYDCDSVTGVYIGGNVTSFGNECFAYCGALTWLYFVGGANVTIGTYAFRSCYNLKYVYIENGSISGAFVSTVGGMNIENVIFGNGVTKITSGAFRSNKIKKVFIPSSVNTISGNIFNGCQSLSEIKVDANNTVYDSREDCNAIIETATNTLVVGCNSTIIPNTVTSIGNDAFNTTYIGPSLVIPDSVTSIGDTAFTGCYRLRSVVIGNGVKSIGYRAFYYSTQLSSITIGNSVETIGNDAFGLLPLQSIYIPASVKVIGSNNGWVFSKNGGLTSIVVDANNTVYDSRDNCNAIIETATNTLVKGCRNTVIPNTVTSLSAASFNAINAMRNITIPNSIISIGDSAFEACTGLTSITIPNSVTTIGTKAFYDCNVLTSVTIEATTPPTLANANAFTINGTANYPIYVPAESVETYKTATNWSSLASRIQAIP